MFKPCLRRINNLMNRKTSLGILHEGRLTFVRHTETGFALDTGAAVNFPAMSVVQSGRLLDQF